jgi:pimeloyl-ACP methyl ester carboxylesterase
MNIVWLILKWLLVLVLVVFILSIVYEQYARYSAKKNFVDNGTYVEVDGHQMHYVKRGEGTPTVVFESGLDFAGHMGWYKVQEEVSKFATTISYDRVGILRSENSSKPRTCENIAEELHTLLEKVEAKKPYILVVHSLGGLIARCYARKYADTLSGIVFVDASHPEQLERAPESIKAKMKSAGLPADWIISLSYYTGLTRMAVNSALPEFVNDDKNIKAIKSEINAYLIESNQGAIKEAKMIEQMTKAAKGVNFGDIPFTVLSAKREGKNEDERVLSKFFGQLQKESLDLSTKSKLISVESGHFIQVEKPEVVIEAIREIVEEN